jgi:aminopeptidase-like protein
VLRTKSSPFEERDFSPYGYDERQYCSPGFNLFSAAFRTPHGEYPEYHTSAYNLEFVSATHLTDSLVTLLEVTRCRAPRETDEVPIPTAANGMPRSFP